MSGVKISALPAVPSAQLTDIFPAVQGGVTYKETNQQLITLVNSTLGPVVLNPTANQTINGAFDLIMATGKMRAPIMQTGQLNDTNSNPILSLNPAVTPVNYFQMSNSATGVVVNLRAIGSDPNVGMAIQTQGTGQIGLYSADLSAPIQFFTGTSNQHETYFNFANTAAARTVTWPDASGTVAFSTSGLAPVAISGTTQSASVDTLYVNQNAGATTITLPATAPLGARVAVCGLGAGGWVLTANAGQTIQVGSSATSAGGTVTSANRYDQIEVVCLVANTTWGTRSVLSAGVTIA